MLSAKIDLPTSAATLSNGASLMSATAVTDMAAPGAVVRSVRDAIRDVRDVREVRGAPAAISSQAAAARSSSAAHAGSQAVSSYGAGSPAQAAHELFDAAGAPALEAPRDLPDVDALLGMAQATQQMANEVRLSSKVNDMYADTKRRVDANVALQNKRLQEWKEKCAEAKSSGTFSKIFDWIGKILGPVMTVLSVVLAGAATIATGGVATPFLVMALMGLASTVLGAAGTSASDLCSKVICKAAQAFGASPEAAKNIGDAVAGGVLVLASIAFPAVLVLDPTALGKLARGVANLAGVDKGTVQTIEGVCNIVGALAAAGVMIGMTLGAGLGSAAAMVGGNLIGMLQSASYVGNGVMGAVTTANGAVSLKLAFDERGIEMSDAQRKLTQRLVAIVREDLVQIQDILKRAFDEVGRTSKESLDMISDYVRALIDRASIPVAA